MERPKVAILDGDILAYKAACFGDIEGIDWVDRRLQDDVQKWTPPFATKVYLALSCDRKDNFRRQWWPEYKMHREGTAQPDCLRYTVDRIHELFDVKLVPTVEADDLMGVAMSGGYAIAVTIDKDLLTVPGWLWNPEKYERPIQIIRPLADFEFCKQWIMGDRTDGYNGLWKWGVKKSAKYLQKAIDDNDDLEERVKVLYHEVGVPKGTDMTPEEYCIAMGVCARILRHGELVDGKPSPKVGANSIPRRTNDGH